LTVLVAARYNGGLLNGSDGMRQKLIIGNWKMNGSLQRNAALLSALATAAPSPSRLVVCAPFVYLAQCRDMLGATSLAWGAQDVSMHEAGAYTGEVSAAMLRDFGCSYAIVGHSERRAYHGETDEMVARKAQQARAAGLMPIVCVGETLQQREAGLTREVVQRQLDAVLEALTDADLMALVLAYEPVWAIGTGKTASPVLAQEVHQLLRARVAAKHAPQAAQVPILYGGSMKPENAAALMAMPDIDGGLIGGAALMAADFLAIANAAAHPV